MKSAAGATLLVTLTLSTAMRAQDLKPVQLPAPQTEIGKPLMQAIALRHSTRSFDASPLSLQDIANVLWAANGINRSESGKRTVPSALNWQETDVYVVLAEGAYLYDAKSNMLNPVVAGDIRGSTGTQEFVRSAPLNLVYVVDEKRVSRVGREESRLYTAADVGFIAENVYLYCASEGLGVVVRGSVDRPKLSEVLKLRPDQKIILAQTVGHPGK